MQCELHKYMDTPEVLRILHYWGRRYSINCTEYTKQELLSEAYLGAWETILKFSGKPFEELLKLISLGVKWKLCDYISKQQKWKLISVTDHIEYKGSSDDVEGMIYVRGELDNMDVREKLVVTRTMEGHTLVEIGKELKVSKQRVFQLLRRKR